MSGPDPATTEWVPLWDTKGTPLGGGSAPHAVTHNTGGTDPLTAISGTIITSGIIPDVRLSSNIPLINKSNSFVGRQYIKGGPSDSPTPYYGIEIIGPDLLGGGHAAIIFNALDRPVDQRKWRIFNYTGSLSIGTLNDAENAGTDVIKCQTTGTVEFFGAITTGGAIHSTTQMYPGNVNSPGIQTSWYLGSHGSYGLYSNTGFYAVGGIWGVAHVYSGGPLYEYGRATALGSWIDVPHGSHYGAGGSASWNVQVSMQLQLRYTLIGKTMMISFNIQNSNINGVSNELRINIPTGALSSTQHFTGHLFAGIQDNTPSVGYCVTGANRAWISLFRINNEIWPETKSIGVRGAITIELA